jgi:hypothetical protein
MNAPEHSRSASVPDIENDSYGLAEFVTAIRNYALRYGIGVEDPKLVDELKERTVRHYQSLGVIDRPEKTGREARYMKRHLLQMLVALRARASTGISPRALAGNLTSMKDDALMDMLVHGVQVSFSRAPTKELSEPQVNVGALDRLAKLQDLGDASLRRPRELHAGMSRLPERWMRNATGREATARAGRIRDEVLEAFTRQPEQETDAGTGRVPADVWSRYRFAPGVELHVRRDLEESTIENLVGAIESVLLPSLR